MKRLFAFIISMVLLLNITGCSEGKGKVDKVDLACKFIEAAIEKDRATLRDCMYPEFYRDRVDEMLEDHDNGLKVTSIKVVSKGSIDTDEYEERLVYHFDLSAVEVEEAYCVQAKVEVAAKDGSTFPWEMGAAMAKIDGRWYVIEPLW